MDFSYCACVCACGVVWSHDIVVSERSECLKLKCLLPKSLWHKRRITTPRMNMNHPQNMLSYYSDQAVLMRQIMRAQNDALVAQMEEGERQRVSYLTMLQEQQQEDSAQQQEDSAHNHMFTMSYGEIQEAEPLEREADAFVVFLCSHTSLGLGEDIWWDALSLCLASEFVFQFIFSLRPFLRKFLEHLVNFSAPIWTRS